MGTRADFYIGIDKNAKWLGSIAWDGYPEGIDEAVLQATTEDEFLVALVNFAEGRNDWTKPEMGWPWPWDDSNTTDYAYGFSGGEVLSNCFGHGWQTPDDRTAKQETYQAWEDADYEGEEPEDGPFSFPTDFPDMTDIQSVTLGARSGIILLGSK